MSGFDYGALTRDIADGIYSAQATEPSLKGVRVYVTEERSFVGESVKGNPDTVFVVVKYGDSSLNQGQPIIPVTLTVFGEPGTLDKARTLLSAFAKGNNLRRSGGILQQWSLPRIDMPFVDTGIGIRTLFTMEGIFTFAGDIGNQVTILAFVGDDGVETEVSIVSFTESFHNSLRPQPLSDGSGRTESRSAFGTYSFGISANLTKNAFFSRLLDVKDGRKGPDTAFRIRIGFLDGTEKDGTYRLSQFSGRQEIGGTYTVTATFAE